jgi:predicted HAD superfamily Cof-like phosphohydrolase
MEQQETQKQACRPVSNWQQRLAYFYEAPHPHYDMRMMHDFYGITDKVNNLSKEQLLEFLHFRFKFLQEELNEGLNAIEEKNPEEILDALVDLTVIAVGTIDLFGCDFTKAWFEVLRANMSKQVGIKASRPNKLGLPDLIKPEGWIAPSHAGNHGLLSKVFE